MSYRLRELARSYRFAFAAAAVVVMLVVSSLWAYVSYALFRDFRSGIDLTIFSQAAESMANGNLPRSSVKGNDYILWGDHFHPIIAFLGPIYWLWPSPLSLLWVQAAAIGVASAVLCFTGCEALHDVAGWSVPKALRGGILVGLLFGVSPGIEGGAFFDFHEVALALPILALACRGLLLDRTRSLILWSALFLLTKEDAGLIVMGLGLVAWVRNRKSVGGILFVGGFMWTILCMRVFIPYFARGPWAYGGKIPMDPSALLDNVVSNLIYPGSLSIMLAVLVLRTGLLAPFSSFILAVVPNIASRALTSQAEYYSLGYHYNMVLAVILIAGLIDVLCRYPCISTLWWRTFLVGCLAATLIGARFPRALLAASDAERAVNARCASALIPQGEGVVADAYLTPYLSMDHSPVRELRPELNVSMPGGVEFPEISWVVVDRETINYSDQNKWAVRYLQESKDAGWREMGSCGSFVALAR
ncbi:DUF2079 domain-containing protein [Luteococcus sp. Sow4_B9]|uniref:DUF2079 domain-containing protein n=1 Tax=Luteococcus sp. Sow4_B9 TaxID=3438792 RepID=UPI003F9CB795